MHNSLQSRKIFIAICLEKINPKFEVYNEILSLNITQLGTRTGGAGNKRLSSYAYYMLHCLSPTGHLIHTDT